MYAAKLHLGLNFDEVDEVDPRGAPEMADTFIRQFLKLRESPEARGGFDDLGNESEGGKAMRASKCRNETGSKIPGLILLQIHGLILPNKNPWTASA